MRRRRNALPAGLEYKIRFAAKSLRDWREEIILDAIDPRRKLTTASNRLSEFVNLGLPAVGVGACAGVAAGGVLLGCAAAFVAAVVAGLLRRGRGVNWWVPVVPVLALGLCAPWWAVTVAALVVVAATVERRWLAVGASVVMVAVGLVSPWGAVVVAVAVAVWSRGAVFVELVGVVPRRGVASLALHRPIPHPPSTLPILVRARLRFPSVERELAAAQAAVTSPVATAALEDAHKKEAGAVAERRTALRALLLPRGWVSMNDLDLPGAEDANIDHMFIGPAGAFVVDSKQFGRRGDPAVIDFDAQSRQCVVSTSRGAHPLTRELRTLAWAVKRVRELLPGAPVRGVMCVENTTVEEGMSVEVEEGVVVHVVTGEGLLGFVTGLERAVDRAGVSAVVERAGDVFVHHDGVPVAVTRPLILP